MTDQEKFVEFFRPEDFKLYLRNPETEVLFYSGPVSDEYEMARLANAKLEAEFGNEYSIVMFWKEKMLEERAKAEHLEMLLCEFMAEKGCGYCNDCVPCGSGYHRIKLRIEEELKK